MLFVTLFFCVDSEDQIARLYMRFTRLDRDASGGLSTDELLTIPELAMNPLANRIILIFQENQRRFSSVQLRPSSPKISTSSLKALNPGSSDNDTSKYVVSNSNRSHTLLIPDLRRSLNAHLHEEEIDFRTFVKTLSVFHPSSPIQEKIACTSLH